MGGILLSTLIILQGCTALLPLLETAIGGSEGIQAEAQIGSNENKTKNGIGKIGSTTTTDIEDNEGTVKVDNDSGRYHIESDKNIKVEIHETSNWIYAIFGIYFLSHTGLSWYTKQKEKKKRHGYYPNIVNTTVPTSSGDTSNKSNT